MWLNTFKCVGKFLSLQYLGTMVVVTAADPAADIFVVPPVCSIISLQKYSNITLSLKRERCH